MSTLPDLPSPARRRFLWTGAATAMQATTAPVLAVPATRAPADFIALTNKLTKASGGLYRLHGYLSRLPNQTLIRDFITSPAPEIYNGTHGSEDFKADGHLYNIQRVFEELAKAGVTIADLRASPSLLEECLRTDIPHSRHNEIGAIADYLESVFGKDVSLGDMGNFIKSNRQCWLTNGILSAEKLSNKTNYEILLERADRNWDMKDPNRPWLEQKRAALADAWRRQRTREARGEEAKGRLERIKKNILRKQQLRDGVRDEIHISIKDDIDIWPLPVTSEYPQKNAKAYLIESRACFTVTDINHLLQGAVDKTFKLGRDYVLKQGGERQVYVVTDQGDLKNYLHDLSNEEYFFLRARRRAPLAKFEKLPAPEV
jgi:hypothetical protein